MRRKKLLPFLIDILIVFLNGVKQVVKDAGKDKRND